MATEGVTNPPSGTIPFANMDKEDFSKDYFSNLIWQLPMKPATNALCMHDGQKK